MSEKRVKAILRKAAYKRFAAGKTLELAEFISGNSKQMMGAPARWEAA